MDVIENLYVISLGDLSFSLPHTQEIQQQLLGGGGGGNEGEEEGCVKVGYSFLNPYESGFFFF